MSDDGPIDRDAVRASPVSFDRIPLDHEHCLLCGSPLGTTGTQEHVFPRWLQRRHDLWSQELHLLNGTSIPYRSLKVPCCAPCNNEALSQLEIEVGGAVRSGFSDVAALAPIRLYQWAAKILLGILFKELALARDRRDESVGTIITSDEFDEYVSIHDLLQSVRVPATFVGGPLYSTLVCPVHDLGGSDSFHFADSIEAEVVAFRLGELGIIVSLADGGLSETQWRPVLDAFGMDPLHPIQFDELVAHVVQIRAQMTGGVRRLVSANKEDGSNLTFVRLSGFSAYPPLTPFDEEILRPLLRHYMSNWRAVVEDMWTRENGVGTTLFAAEGQVAIVDRSFEVLETRPVVRDPPTAP